MDVVATSEVSVSVTLDPAKYWERDLFDEELHLLEKDIQPIGKVASQAAVRKSGLLESLQGGDDAHFGKLCV